MPHPTPPTSAPPLVLSEGAHDPSSKAYKKARRQFLKTTRNRAADADADWTPFRAAEKRYKARFPPPDLAGVLDLAALDTARTEECARGGWTGRADAVEWREVALSVAGDEDEEAEDDAPRAQDAPASARRRRRRRAYAVPHVPGLVLLPAFVRPAEQRALVRWALSAHARAPHETNLDTHYAVPAPGVWALAHGADPLVEPRAPVLAAGASSGPGLGASHPPDAAAVSDPGPSTRTPAPAGPRQLISNTPASPATLPALLATPKPPPEPSATAAPARASTLVRRLRWANIGWSYHWGSKQYDFARGRGSVDGRVEKVCRGAVEGVRWGDVFKEGAGQGGGGEGVQDEKWGEEGPDWQTWGTDYEPDAGIVNFYQTNDTLMAHVDRSEVCATSPLVSISLGCAAIFLIGGRTRNAPPVPVLLRSGDVVIMAGPRCRRAYHGVPRILPNTLPAHLEREDDDDDEVEDAMGKQQADGGDAWAPYAAYLRGARINVNVRQVFPKGFDPAAALGLGGGGGSGGG